MASARPPQRGGWALGVAQTVENLVDDVARRLGTPPDSVPEARDLIAALLDVPRHWPLLRENKWVDSSVWQRACAAADARARGAPLAYAVGQASFRALTLVVDGRVLIPRPETELLVDLVLERCAPGGVAVDVGTGSGAIALSLALEGRFDRIVATDLSLDALEVARENARRLAPGAVEFLHGDLLRPVAGGGLRAVVSNPPYVSYDEIAALPGSVRDWEPPVALFSGRHGLDATARLVRQAGGALEPGGLLALEVDATRASLVAELVASDARFDEVTVKLDLAGRERFVLARRVPEDRT
ncbi:MAG: peptide chain release factor N(5)-glutamine methyltransferase [Gemmatimonadaceae bacterium]